MAATDPQPASGPGAGRTFFDWTVDEPIERPATGGGAMAEETSLDAGRARGSAALGSADYGAPIPSGFPDPEPVMRVA